jgi:hypothetical protein
VRFRAVLPLAVLCLSSCRPHAERRESEAPPAASTSVKAAPAPAASDWRALALPPAIARLFETGVWDETPAEFRVIALSFVADGCAARGSRDHAARGAARSCVARVLVLAQKTRPVELSVEAADAGLWLTHLNLMLGASDRLGSCADAREHLRVSTALARRSLAEPTFHVPSYPGKPYRWPADQSATLASLFRFDRAHKTSLAELPARRWRELVSKQAMDSRLQLPWSEVTGKARGARDPRGCALSWQTRFVREFDPDLAST